MLLCARSLARHLSRGPSVCVCILLQRPNISMVCKARLLRRASCLLYTPHNEHFGIVPVEAMYAECPVIAVNSGGPLESVAEGVTGFLRPQEPQLWADAISTLVADPAQGARMGKAGRQRVVDTFSLESFARTLDFHVRSGDDADAGDAAAATTAEAAATATTMEAPVAAGGSKKKVEGGGNPPRRSARLRTSAKK